MYIGSSLLLFICAFAVCQYQLSCFVTIHSLLTVRYNLIKLHARYTNPSR